MFDSDLVKQLRDEVAFLRGMVKDLQDRLMSLNESSFLNYKMVANDEPGEAKILNEMLGVVESMTPNGPEEEKDKKDAVELLRTLTSC